MTRFRPPMPPAPEGLSALGKIRAYLGSGLALFTPESYDFEGVSRQRLPHLPGTAERRHFSVRDTASIREMLVSRPGAFPKGALIDQMLRKLTGYSIFVANGEAWERQRRIIDQAFTHAGVRAVFPLMHEATEACLDRLAASSPGEVPIDVEMTHFAGDVIFRTIYSEPMTAGQAQRIFSAFDVFQEIAFRQGMIGAFGIPIRLLPSNVRAVRMARTIRQELDRPLQRRLAAQRMGGAVPDTDILSALMTARDPVTGTGFDGDELLDQIAMLFLAGHETSAAALGWTLYLLAKDPAAQDALRGEAVAVIGERAPVFADIKRLERTRNAFREAMRLYPPVAFLSRDVSHDETLAGTFMPAGSSAVIPTWLMHRHKAHWDDPHAFDADRFSRPETRDAQRLAYMPFSLGARVCVGAAFALQEATLVLASILRRFRLETLPGHEPQPVSRLTVRSANGIRLRLEPV